MSDLKESALRQGVHLMAKPAGPVCNLACRYCFYLEKENLYPQSHRFLMSDEVLRAYIAQNIRNEPSPEVLFTWQGGEPLLRGLAFFKQAVAYQRELAGDKRICNALQTNGMLLDEAWCEFLAEAGFLVGISLDGPREIHDRDRVDKHQRATFDAVMRGVRLLQKHAIEFNVLVTVSRNVSRHAKEVYQFLKAQGIAHIQFNPVVERQAAKADAALGLTFAAPPKAGGSGEDDRAPQVTAESVTAEGYGDFLIAIFDEWVRHDVGTVYVMNFEWALAAWLQLPATICLFARECGRALILEHNGDVYACDHFVYPDYLLGNIQQADLLAMADSPRQVAFGAAKAALPEYCRQCAYLFACNGECPKNRFVRAPDGEAGLNYLCPSYKKYFSHITGPMNTLAKLLSQNQPASRIMEAGKGRPVVSLPGRKPTAG